LASEDTIMHVTWQCRLLCTSGCTHRGTPSTGQKYVLLFRGGVWLLTNMMLYWKRIILAAFWCWQFLLYIMCSFWII